MKKTQKGLKACLRKQGFTLIELLVVIGILSILAVALLIAINPVEAQRKARDTQRLKDITNIQAAIEGWINDHPGENFTGQFTSSTRSTFARDCASGWLSTSGGNATAYSFCNYMNRMPSDPRNASGLVASGNVGSSIATGITYRVNANVSGYHICTLLESLSNGQKLMDDGLTGLGSGNIHFDVYSNSAVNCP